TSFDANDKLDARWLRNSDVLITAAETSLDAHRVAHALTTIANRNGLRTASIQHGYEAPGLTLYDADADVASQVVFTWRERAALPEAMPEELRQRCIGVGRPRPAARPARPKKAPGPAPRM